MKTVFKRLLSATLAILLLIIGLAFSVSAGSTLIWPVQGHTTLTQGFSGDSGHSGIDISDGSISGATVRAAMGGTVCRIYLCGDTHLNEGDCNGFGTGLVIHGDDGRYYQYAHMQANSIPSNVYYGAYVSAGSKVGQVGSTGWSTGPHLHFEINTTNWYTGSVNPMNESYNYNYNSHTCSYSSSVTKVATCNATGVRTYSCSCGKSYTETIAKNASNHAGGTVIKNAIAATPESTGYTGDTYCGGCSKLLKTGTTIPKIDETQWVYVSSLPSHVSSDKYDIEYNNIYKKVATTDNASGWTKGSLAKTEYVNSGSTYESDFELSTSNYRVLVSYYYYHWCGSGAGNEVNFKYTDKHNHYDAYPEPSAVIEEQSVVDGDDSRYTAYKLAWAHNTSSYCWCAPALTCDASNSHDYRSCWWYKRYVYQNKARVDYYNWTKESGWTESKDSSANSVEYRFKLKEHECVYTSSVTTTATCKKAGVRTYTCECGNSYTEVISTLPHTIVTDKAVAATCTSTGKTEGKHCSECGTVTVAQTVIPANAHTPGDWEVLVAPTFKAEGTQVRKCTVCKTVLEERSIPVLEKAPEVKIRRTSTTSINYGDTLVLQLEEVEIPEGLAVAWFVEGVGVSTWVSEDGCECRVTSIANGNPTVFAKLVDENENVVTDADGEEIFDEITIVSKAGFWQKFISFFKNLFGINRVIY